MADDLEEIVAAAVRKTRGNPRATAHAEGRTIIAALAQAGYGIVPVTGEGAVGYALAVRYEDGEFRLDPQGTLFSDLPTAASTCEAVQGGAERRGWGERWFVVKLTEVTDGRP